MATSFHVARCIVVNEPSKLSLRPCFIRKGFLKVFFFINANVSIKLRTHDVSTQTSNLNPKTNREDVICKSVDRLVKPESHSIKVNCRWESEKVTENLHEKEPTPKFLV